MLKFRKITLLIAVLGVVLANKASAQSYYVENKSAFYGGLSLGSTFSQLDGDKFAGYRKIGFTGGAIVYAELAKKFATSLEILYTQKGAVSNRSESPETVLNYRVNKYAVKLDYVEIPVLFNYFDKRKSHFGLGASYSQLVSQRETVTTNPALPTSVDLRDYPFKSADINGIASVNLYLTKGFFLNIRYQYSLFSVRDNVYPDLKRINGNGQHNNFWAFRLMYIFN